MICKHLLFYDIIDSDWEPQRHLTPLGYVLGLVVVFAVIYGAAFAIAIFG